MVLFAGSGGEHAWVDISGRKECSWLALRYNVARNLSDLVYEGGLNSLDLENPPFGHVMITWQLPRSMN